MKANSPSLRPWLNPKSITGRLLLASLVWVFLLLVVGGVVLSAVFRDHVETEFDLRLRQTMDTMIGVSDVDAEGHITFSRSLSDQRFNEPYSGWYWQVVADGMVPVRSRSLWDQELTVDFSHDSFPWLIYETGGPDGQRIRVLERDVTLPGTASSFRFIVAGDVSEVKGHIARFNRIIAWSLGILGAGVLIALVMQVRFGLSPLRQVEGGLMAIRAGERKRLPKDAPFEIRRLVDEMNAVLAQNEKLIERARTQVGNLAHALKTPLAVITNELEHRKKSKFVDMISRQISIIRRHVDHQLARARAIGHSRHIKAKTDVEACIINIGRTIQRIYKDRKLNLRVEIQPDLKFQGEKQDLEEILGNLLDNAAKWAKSTIHVTAVSKRRKGKALRILLAIEDDGPGVTRNQRPALYKRGKRLDEAIPGSGLGLAIVKDLAQIYGGTAHLKRSNLGGLRVEVELPEAET